MSVVPKVSCALLSLVPPLLPPLEVAQAVKARTETPARAMTRRPMFFLAICNLLLVFVTRHVTAMDVVRHGHELAPILMHRYYQRRRDSWRAAGSCNQMFILPRGSVGQPKFMRRAQTAWPTSVPMP